MSKERAKRILLLGVTAALSVSLCACDAKIDETILNNEANTSVDIRLPYVTVTPPPAAKAEAQALEISANGTVTVNDSAFLNADSENQGVGANTNYKSLRLGNTGLAVQVLQNRLRELGYLPTGVTGIFDADTETAVRRFEQTYGTMQTGVATANLQQRLFSDDAVAYASEAYNDAVISQYRILRRGDAGSSVYALQQRLMNLGYPIEKLTGTFDADTAAAVELFYKAYGLSPSDIANVALQKEIYSDSARPYTGGDSDAPALTGNETEIQRRLIELGFLNAANVGETQIKIAEKLFQQACGELASSTMSSRVQKILLSDEAPTFANAYPQYENLSEGSTGDAVTRLQERLVELGFAHGTPTGEYGDATTTSIRLFQAANGMEQTGAATAYVQAVLYSTFALNIEGETVISANAVQDEVAEDVTKPGAETKTTEILSSGSSGDDVLKLQERLTQLGYISSVTGDYDALTGRGVATFQETIGMETNGVADSMLLKFLYSNAAPFFGANFHTGTQNYKALQSGDSGDEVTALQKRLWKMGYLSTDGVKDSVGIYNDATAQAISDLQSAIGYDEPDGIASPEILCFLASAASDSYAK